MILYPAIDLKDGHCVRVLHGDLATATVFNTSPADQAARFVEQDTDRHAPPLEDKLDIHQLEPLLLAQRTGELVNFFADFHFGSRIRQKTEWSRLPHSCPAIYTRPPIRGKFPTVPERSTKPPHRPLGCRTRASWKGSAGSQREVIQPVGRKSVPEDKSRQGRLAAV